MDLKEVGEGKMVLQVRWGKGGEMGRRPLVLGVICGKGGREREGEGDAYSIEMSKRFRACLKMCTIA